MAKIPEFIQMNIEPINKHGLRSKKDLKKLLLLDQKEVTSLDLRLLLRFSKEHYRFHEYKLSKNYSGSLILERI